MQSPKQPTIADAKRVILGIIQENGGQFQGRTALFKAFYHAHSAYWKKHGRHLTSHPIVRMPKGPGIDGWRLIFRQLDEAESWDRTLREYREDREKYRFTDKERVHLTPAEREAIQFGLAQVSGKPVDELTEATHGVAWEQAEVDGAEMAVCLDALTPEEYEREEAAIAEIQADFDAAR